MKTATTSTVLIAMLLTFPAWAGKLVYAPPPPVLLDDAPEKNAAKNAAPQQPALADTTLAVAASRGKLLYENHCLGCHESVVHVRERRQVKSLTELQAQVARWSAYQNLRWNKEDVGEVVRYLNERHYHTK